jgi:hypothetical protein
MSFNHHGDIWCYLKLRTKSAGKMDEATNKAMWQPRCGEKDMLTHNELHSRRRRYALWGECVVSTSHRTYHLLGCDVIYYGRFLIP